MFTDWSSLARLLGQSFLQDLSSVPEGFGRMESGFDGMNTSTEIYHAILTNALV